MPHQNSMKSNMICKLFPTFVLKMMISKMDNLLYNKLKNLSADRITEFNIFFNCSQSYEYNFQYDNDPTSIAIWYCNDSYGIKVYKCKPYVLLIGYEFSNSFSRELFYRLAKEKIVESRYKFLESIL